MKQSAIVVCIAGMLSMLSCDRMSRKGHKLVDKTKTETREKKEHVVDKLFPTFDSYHPDTRFNKRRFEEFFGFAPTPDIKEIYCFGDMMGIDSKFQFAFTCDTTTLKRIVSYLQLKKSIAPDTFGSGLWRSFPWWDSIVIETIPPYSRKGSHELYQYLWFDTTNSKLYYQEFDL